MAAPPPTSVWIIGYMVFNFLSSVGIINLNKLVFKDYQFSFPTFLTGVHFICTFAGLLVCRAAGRCTEEHEDRAAAAGEVEEEDAGIFS